MNVRKIILNIFLVPLLLTGCMTIDIGRDQINSQINVFGVELYSDVDYKDINGVVATEEPCLRGYERNFDALDVSIGYGFDKKIRKITTRNISTSLFGVKPGMAFKDGRKMIMQAGFSEASPPFMFRSNRNYLTFLVDGDNKIFGLTFELLY